MNVKDYVLTMTIDNHTIMLKYYGNEHIVIEQYNDKDQVKIIQVPKYILSKFINIIDN